MKRPAGASCARFSKLTRRRGEGLRRNPPAEAPRIALFWPAAPGARPAGYFGHRVSLSAPRRSTHRKIFSKIVLASAGEFPYSTFSHGGVAQLGERLTGSQEVRGSIPLVSTIVNAKAFGIPKAFFHAKTPRAANPTYATKSCTIYFPCLYIVCWTNAITSTPHWSIRASGASITSASTPISCANVNNIPKQPP